MPNVRRTWAPKGQTPITRHHYRRDKLSVISAVTLSHRRQRVGLYLHAHRENISQTEVRFFLRHLLRHIPGPIVLLWDGGRIHTGGEIRAFLQRHPRLHVESFPAYAPELNPDEQVWTHYKRELSNGRPDNLMELLTELGRITKATRKRPALMRSFITGSELPPFLRS